MSKSKIKQKGWRGLVNRFGLKVTRIRKPRSQVEWAYLVKYRDGFICQNCGSRENLTAHHKKQKNNNWNRRFDIKNGITLCRSCHDIEDSIG